MRGQVHKFVFENIVSDGGLCFEGEFLIYFLHLILKVESFGHGCFRTYLIISYKIENMMKKINRK
jgi:hypothetical protein